MDTGHDHKAEGTGDQAKGNLKETVGKATGDEGLKRQGERDRTEGSLKRAWGNIKNAFSSKH